MMNCIGIDLGTFHTVSVLKNDQGIQFPSHSIRSIAKFVGRGLAVGVDADLQINSPGHLILAPKLKLHDHSESRETISIILRKLVEQSIQALGANIRTAVMTVPPGWSFEDCEVIRESVSILGLNLVFMHEPIALLAAVSYLSKKKECNPSITGLLASTENVFVCDWGAGTVDLAVIKLNHKKNGLDYQCLGETTVLGEGGTDLAMDIVCSEEEFTNNQDAIKTAFFLQLAWQGEAVGTFNFDKFKTKSQSRRQIAANKISNVAAELMRRLCIDDHSKIVTILHGGPLENAELRTYLEDDLLINVGLDKTKIIMAGSDFIRSFTGMRNIRRDCLVAAGAAIYGANGEALPEFEYEIILKDSFGKSTSSVKLIKGKNLSGIQVISPPYTGVDYYVEVYQISNIEGTRDRTPISAELKLFVRKDAVVMYRIAEAGAGFVTVEAAEAQNLPCPELFPDSRIESIILPEKSTRFHIRHTEIR
jgi:hypothetical protein